MPTLRLAHLLLASQLLFTIPESLATSPQAEEAESPVGPPIPAEILRKSRESSGAEASGAGRELERLEALWKSRGAESLPEFAEAFSQLSMRELDPEAAFELAREVAREVPVSPGGGAAIRKMLRGYLTLPADATIPLPGETFRAPWHVQLRLVAGLRPSPEIGPLLVELASEEGSPEAGIPDLARNAVYLIGFLRYSAGLEDVLRFSRTSPEARDLAAQTLGQLRHVDGAPRLLEILRQPVPARTFAVAAGSLVQVLGAGATQPLVEQLGEEDEERARALVTPLIQLATPESLAALEPLTRLEDRPLLKRALDFQLGRYARGAGLTRDQLVELMRDDPAAAAAKIAPLAHLLESMRPDDRELLVADLLSVIADWEKGKTLYIERWSWVRDRHVIDATRRSGRYRAVAHALERARIAILSEYRTTCVNEAEVIQRILGSVLRARRQANLAPPATPGSPGEDPEEAVR